MERMNLSQAPQGVRLKIVDISGGEQVRRRLLSLGFHKGDEIERIGQGILRGPLLIKMIRSGGSVAIGRGIALKILVEVADGHE
jgi:Fe2+ transport system protein FeoA